MFRASDVQSDHTVSPIAHVCTESLDSYIKSIVELGGEDKHALK